jgi:hypothetical protein
MYIDGMNKKQKVALSKHRRKAIKIKQDRKAAKK